VHVLATVGVRIPNWVAVPTGAADAELGPAWRPGTISIILSVPVPLSEAAYVIAGITAPEAKTQGVLEAEFGATGTAYDAMCIAAPVEGLRRLPGCGRGGAPGSPARRMPRSTSAPTITQPQSLPLKRRSPASAK
jgi:Adenosylcobinamide amidohydrolase